MMNELQKAEAFEETFEDREGHKMSLREPAKDELQDFASIDRRSRTKALRLKRIFHIQVNVFLK